MLTYKNNPIFLAARCGIASGKKSATAHSSRTLGNKIDDNQTKANSLLHFCASTWMVGIKITKAGA